MKCKICKAGYWTATTETQHCTGCVKGKYLEDEAFKSSNHDAEVDCLICPNGHYNDIVGSNKCIECDPGRYIDDAGATVTKHNAKSSCLACASPVVNCEAQDNTYIGWARIGCHISGTEMYGIRMP